VRYTPLPLPRPHLSIKQGYDESILRCLVLALQKNPK